MFGSLYAKISASARGASRSLLCATMKVS